MTPAEQIAHHIATNGIIKCPPAIAAHGWTPGLCIVPPPSDDAPERFNGPDTSPKKRGNSSRDAANAARQRTYDARRRDIAAAYGADPRPETIFALADQYRISLVNCARMIREAGYKNVVTTINRKGGWAHIGTSERMNAVFDVMNAAAEKGIECPSNPTLSACLNMGDSTVSSHITRLVDAGRVIVTRMPNYRIVTIVATGKKTKQRATARTASYGA